jgi:hypothetical protein
MRRLFFCVLILAAIPTASYSATYYGCADQEITATGTFEDQADCAGTPLTWASLANGDVLNANGRTISIANDIGSVSVAVTLQVTATGGGYTYNTSAVTGKILYTNITNDQTTQALLISGSGSDNPVLTINGNITGGSTSSDYGVLDTHTVGRVVINGTATGGTNTTAYAYRYAGATSHATDITSCVGDTADGCMTVGTGTIYVATCTGDEDSQASGCYGSVGGPIVITGNIIGTPYASGARGAYIWEPSLASNYLKIFNGGSDFLYVFAALGNSGGTKISAANTAAEIKSGTYFVKSDDGVYTNGTASTSSGSASAW